MKKTRKALLLGVCAVLLVTASVLGTMAYLTDTTQEITNTFTVGKVDIDLTETTGEDYKMVPGTDITKDPKVTVTEGSEDCYLFVKLEKSANFDTYLTYEMADGWTLVEGQTNVYSRVVNAKDTVKEFSVLAGDKVSVKNTVTNEMSDKPTLKITAYACQKEGFTDAKAAWAEVLSPTK